MTSPALSRRSFLAVTGGLLVATACGTSGKSGGAGSVGNSTGVRKNGLNAGRLSIEPYVSTTPERFAFALSTDRVEFASGPAATIAFKPPGGAFGAPMPATLHSEGLPEGRGVYVVDVPLPQAGVWGSVARVTGHPDAPLSFEVVAQPQVPVPGGAAPRVASPTTANPLGVDPLCTAQPPCPLHTVSLDALVGAGKPVAVMFATPARCQSRYCGPVLDQLLAVYHGYGDRIAFVHCEIYKNATTAELVPTVDAWGLPGEPWLFGIDATGKITARLDGAMGTDEVKALLDRLVT